MNFTQDVSGLKPSQVDACTQSSQQPTYCVVALCQRFVIWWLYQTKLWTARSHTFQQSVMDTKPDCLHRSGMARRVHINSHGELLGKVVQFYSTSMITKVSTCVLASCHLTWTLLPSMNFRIRAVQLGMQAWLHNPGTFAPSASWRMISKAIWDSLVLVHHFLEVAFSHSHHSKSRSFSSILYWSVVHLCSWCALFCPQIEYMTVPWRSEDWICQKGQVRAQIFFHRSSA